MLPCGMPLVSCDIIPAEITTINFHPILSYVLQQRVLETWVLVSRHLKTRFYKSWSWSWNPRVSVLGPWRLGLCHSWSVKLRQNRKSFI